MNKIKLVKYEIVLTTNLLAIKIVIILVRSSSLYDFSEIGSSYDAGEAVPGRAATLVAAATETPAMEGLALNKRL